MINNKNVEIMDAYRNKTVLITGGCGFIGSNLAKLLSENNCSIIIFDSFHPLYGGNKFNLHDINDAAYSIVKGDVRDKEKLKHAIKKSDIIFHFAAQVSYIDSLSMPYEDYEVTASSTLTILEILRELGKRVKVIFSSSRMVLGRAYQDIITEDHPTNPLTLYGIHKLTAEKYLKIYSREFDIPYTIMRITNPYGPKQQIKHSKYSLVGWFIRQAMEAKTIRIFGDGKQKRDYIYIDDIVNAFAAAGVAENTTNKTYNLGSGISLEFREMVKTITEIIPSASYEFVQWPDDYERVETGNLIVDNSKLKKDIDWAPSVDLYNGIVKTYEYYNKYKKNYT